MEKHNFMKSKKPLLHYALDLLAKKRYSSGEMRKKLTTKSQDSDEMEKVMARLNELNYLNDGEYAGLFIEDQLRRAPQGILMIKKRLEAKGLDRQQIMRAIEIKHIDEKEFARKALIKKMRFISRQEPSKINEKLYRFLLSRGFTPRTAMAVLEEQAGQLSLI
jgi:regulatory protein